MDMLIGQKPRAPTPIPGTAAAVPGPAGLPGPSAADEMIVDGTQKTFMHDVIEASRTIPVLVDFWATWCGPCRAELPHLETLSKKYSGRAAFYGINSSDPPNAATAYARQNNLTFPMLSDTDHHVAFQYGADSIPLLVIVDTHGKVRAVTDGYSENVETELSKTLDALLAEEKRTP